MAEHVIKLEIDNSQAKAATDATVQDLGKVDAAAGRAVAAEERSEKSAAESFRRTMLERTAAADNFYRDRIYQAKVLFSEEASLERGMRRAREEAAATQRGFSAMGGGSQSAAMGLLMLGQAVDDVQYGFRAIVNNIPQIVLAFTGSVGLAGAAGIVAVAANQLTTHWGELMGAFGRGATNTEAEAMQALADATHKTLEETIALDAQKRKEKAAAEAAIAQTKAEKERAEAVKTAVEEAGGGRMIARFAQSRLAEQGTDYYKMAQQEAADQRARQQARRGPLEIISSGEQWSMLGSSLLRGLGLQTETSQMRDRMRAIQERVEKGTSQVLVGGDVNSIRKAIGDIQANPSLYPEGAAAKLQAVLPENVENLKAREAATRAYRFAAAEMAHTGEIDREDPTYRAFEAEQLPLSALGAVSDRVRARALQTARQAAAMTADDPTRGDMNAKLVKYMEEERRTPMHAERPRAGAAH